MEAAFAWLSDLMRFLASLLPRLVIVAATERTVVFRHGWQVKVWQPGLHIYWPIVTRIQTMEVNRQIMQLHLQRLVTSDGVTVQIGATVPYVIAEPDKLVMALADEADTMCDEALPIIAEYVLTATYEELRRGSARSRRRLAMRLRRKLAKWGVRVLGFRFSDLAPARVLSIPELVPQTKPGKK